MKQLSNLRNICYYINFLSHNRDKDVLSNFIEEEEKTISRRDTDINTYNEIGIEFLSFTKLILSDILDLTELNSEIFGRISSNLLFGFKFCFPCISYTLFKKIVENLVVIKSMYPSFYDHVLLEYLYYSTPKMFFPYTQRNIYIFDIYANYKLLEDEAVYKEITQEIVGIVIPFYFLDDEKFIGRLDALKKNILSIKRQTYTNHSVCLFINNMPHDREKEIEQMLSEYGIDKIYFSHSNVGAAKARNMCVEYFINQKVPPTYILFLDDDSLFIDEKCILKMVYAFQSDKENVIGAVSPIILHSPERDGFVLDQGYEAPWQLSIDKSLSCFNSENRKHSTYWKESFMLEGSCMMVRTLLMKNSIKFPEEYNYYFEEGLLGCRIRKDLGKLLVVVQNTYMLHTKIGGGGKSIHSMYYMLRNFGYFIQDLGIKKGSDIYINLMHQQNEYLNMLIQEVGGGKKFIDRVMQANNDLDNINMITERNRKTDEYDIDAPILLF